MSTSNLSTLEPQLVQLLSSLKVQDSPELWKQVEQTSRTLADSLRVRDKHNDYHTSLGKTELPQTITALVTLSLHGSSIPPDAYAEATLEILRIAANLCLDHDANRGYLLDAGVPQVIVSLLEGYAEKVPLPTDITPLELSVLHLKVVRTAIGVLLNASIGYDAVRFRLTSLETGLTLLKLSSAIYPTMSWMKLGALGNLDTATRESWQLRSGIANWAWRTVSELKDTKEDGVDTKDDSRQTLSPDVLPWITPVLAQYIPPFAEFDATSTDVSLYTTLVQTDFDILEESCGLIESLCLDSEDIRLALARGFCFSAEHSGVPCFKTLLEFIEHGGYPPSWQHPSISREDKARKEKAFNICKGALIKAVVEVVSEEKNEEVLWDDSIESKPGGEFVFTMVRWLKDYVQEARTAPAGLHRDDLVICASLSLGNLARRETTSTALLSEPLSLASTLSSSQLLAASTDVKMKHGVIGLLKHLSQSASLSPVIPESLAKASVVQLITESGIWDEGADAMAITVQLNAIGVAKHLCHASVDHAIALTLPPANQSSGYKTGLQRILALVARSDSVPIKSEGTRVLVNVIRRLLLRRTNSISVDSKVDGQTDKTEKVSENQVKLEQKALTNLLNPSNVNTLSWFLARSGKFPILVNEAIVGLNLLCTQKGGADIVLDSILTPVPESNIGGSSAPLSPVGSESGSLSLTSNAARTRPPVTRHGLEMLSNVLRNTDNPANYAVEIRVNACTFFIQLTRQTSNPKLVQIKETIRPVLEAITNDTTLDKGNMLRASATKLLEMWKPS